ncbi:MAG: GcrA family cell cycle regulator [Pseudomonadota bacterium]
MLKGMSRKERSQRVLKARKNSKSTGVGAVYALRDSHCKWPIGEPGKAGFHFCGKQSKEGSPYCAGHQQMALRA